MQRIAAICLLTTTLLDAGATAEAAPLRGHGGPVRAIAVTADGESAITGSFDTRAIVWSLATGEAREVLLFHDGQVNAVAALPDGRFATAGADGRIALWETGQSAPSRVLEGHTGPVAALAVSPDGSTLASASWDTKVGLWPLAGGAPRMLQGHEGNVNAVAFLADGGLVSAGYDATVIFWPQEDILQPRGGGTPPARVVLPTPLNALATADTLSDSGAAGAFLFVGGADGTVRMLDGGGEIRGEIQASTSPLIALAASPDGRYLAAAGINDAIVLIDAARLAPVRELDPSGTAVWSLAFTADGGTLLAGGADHVVREWDVETGEQRGAIAAGSSDPMADYAAHPDAAAFRACIACHTLDAEEGPRAGPTLDGIFGRPIGSVPGYHYSPAFGEMDIIWTPETVSKLFELGPNAYTPGTKMPEQRIGDAEDRAALIRFLQDVSGFTP